MKLTLKERNQVKEFAKKLVEERITPKQYLIKLSNVIKNFQETLKKEGYTFNDIGK